MRELFETVLQEIPGPDVDLEAPFQMVVTNLDYSDYLGAHRGGPRAARQSAARRVDQPDPQRRHDDADAGVRSPLRTWGSHASKPKRSARAIS